MTTLTDLANHYGTDKGTRLPDHHGYTEYYEHWCAPRRNDVLRILELGILNGASLRMWADYFPHALVCGVDIEPVAPIDDFDGRIHVAQIDQCDINELTVLAQRYGVFDLIVDDAGHESDAHLLSVAALLPYLAPGGRYCIEDVLVEQPVMGFVTDEFPQQWGVKTTARAAALRWTVQASRYAGRFVVMGDAPVGGETDG